MNTAAMARLAARAQRAEQNDLLWTGIFSPDYGEQENIPNILLPDAMTAENRDILLYEGELQRMKGRLPDLLEAEFATGTVTVTNGSATVTASGGAGTWSAAASHKPCWGSDQCTAGRTIKIYDDGVWNTYTIKTPANDGATLTLTANYTQTGGSAKPYKIGTAGQRLKAPDGYPILRYHQLLNTATGIEYLMVFTKAHAYLWDTSWSAFILKFTCGSNATAWSTVSFNNQIIASNNIDKIQTWGATINNAFTELGAAGGLDTGGGTYLTKAKYLFVYSGYVLAAEVTIGGTFMPFQMNWCSKNNAADWDQTGSGDTGDMIINEGERFRGFGIYAGFCIIFKESRTYRMWLVTTDEVFDKDVELPNVGCLSAETIVNDRDGKLYWLATDFTIRELRAGIISGPKEKTVKGINVTLAEQAKASYIDEYNHVWFSLPSSAASTGNDIIITYDVNGGKWGQFNIAVSAFGEYKRQSVYTWLTLPYANWLEWGWLSWIGPENTIGFPLNLLGDYDGYTYDAHLAEKDNSADYEGYFVLSTDMLQQQMIKRYGTALGEFKRLAALKLIFRKEAAGTLNVSLKRDNEPNWQAAGSVSLADAVMQRDIAYAEINNINFRAKHYLLRIGASNRFRFIGVMMGFLPDGKY